MATKQLQQNAEFFTLLQRIRERRKYPKDVLGYSPVTIGPGATQGGWRQGYEAGIDDALTILESYGEEEQ